MITFADGTTIDTTDFQRLLEIVAERSRTGNQVSEIKSNDGVTVKVGNLKSKDGIVAEHSNYIESLYKGYAIRVWLYRKEKMWGCNCIKGDYIRYLEFHTCDYNDENHVIRDVQRYIEQGQIG